MHYQMDYNGPILKWGSRGSFKATSVFQTHNYRKNQCTPDSGPIPESFYLHDSTKGYSHGCIEVETRIFPLLRAFNKATKNNTIVIKVKYNKGVATNGGTKI